MNTPEQEAEQLINDFYVWGIKKEGQSLSKFECRQLALISVDKIITAEMEGDIIPYGLEKIKYWETVKKIIQSK